MTSDLFQKAVEVTPDKANFNANYIFERKYDGQRIMACHLGLISSSDINRQDRFSNIWNEYKTKIGTDIVLDSEIYIEGGNVLQLNASKNWDRAEMCVFDVLNYKGEDLKNKPFSYRQELLKKIIPESRLIHLPESWTTFQLGWNQVESRQLEGLMAKNLNGIYEMGKRSKNWIKIKLKLNQDVEIVGYEAGSGGTTKGTFIVKMNSGTLARVSGTSMDIVRTYQQDKPKKMEIAFMYITDEGKPFQPTFSKFIEESQWKN